MRYTTLDIELADRFLQSICSISIIEWEDNRIISEFNSHINPDCEVEEFFLARHGLSNEILQQAPTLGEKWIKIYDMMDGKMIFAHHANRVIRDLMHIAELNYLNMPDIKFGCSASIAKRTWTGLEDYRLPYLTEYLNITNIHNNSNQDAKAVASIIQKSAAIHEEDTVEGLFHKIGYSGGVVENKSRIIYRAAKNKNGPGYIKRTKKEN